MKVTSIKYRALAESGAKWPECRLCPASLHQELLYEQVCNNENCLKQVRCPKDRFESEAYLCRICISSNKQCFVCHNALQDISDLASSSLRNFLKITCINHEEVEAVFYDKVNFSTFCSECPKKVGLFNISTCYRDLKNYFFRSFNENRKKFCPERRESLVTYTSQELLQACRWLMEYERIKCNRHKTEDAVCINNRLLGFCDQCKAECRDPLFLNFNEQNMSQSAVNKISDIVKEFAKVSPPENLNKFIIALLKNKGASNATRQSVNLLILEGRDLLNNLKYSSTRCIYCTKRTSEGKRKAIVCDCKHIICFECYFTKEIERCHIDHVELKNFKYYNNQEYVAIPESGCFHSVLDSKLVIKKLPCSHYSCEGCTEFNFCLKCGFKFTDWDFQIRPAEKLEELIDFCTATCNIHGDSKIIAYSENPLELYCESCLKNNDRQFFSLIDRNNLMSMIKYLRTLTEILSLTSPNSCVQRFSILKQASFLAIIPIQTCLNLFFSLSSLKNIFLEFFPGSFHCRFDEILPKRLTSVKVFQVPEKKVIGCNITVNKDMYLSGFILGGRYYCRKKEEFLYFSPKIRIVGSCRAADKREFLESDYEFQDLRSYCDKTCEVLLNRSFYLSDKGSYDIIIELPPGLYFHGEPKSRKALNDVTISRLMKVPDGFTEIGNNAIGGPLLGFRLSLFS